MRERERERGKLVCASFEGDLLHKLAEVVQNAQVCDRPKERTAQLWKTLLGEKKLCQLE